MKKKTGKEILEELLNRFPKKKLPDNIDWDGLCYSEIEERFKKRN